MDQNGDLGTCIRQNKIRKWEDDLMECNLSLWYTYSSNFDNVWDCLPIHCVIPCVINLQAPTPKFGKEYGARDSPHHPPKLKPVIEPQFLTFKPNHPNKNYNCLTNRCPHFINVTPIKIHPVLTPGVFSRIINLLSYEVLLGSVRMATI